jgi:hypothetical protein
MPISRSAAVRRGFAAKARCRACANEIDRGALSAPSTGIVTTSSAHIRRKATPSIYINSTGKAERQRRGSAARSYDFQVKCLGGGVSTQGWSSSRNVGASKDSLTGSAEGSETGTSTGITTGAQV